VKNFATARDCAEQLQALAVRTSDELTCFFADYTAGWLSYTSGDYVSARDYFERALNLSDGTRQVLVKNLDTTVGIVNCTGALGLSLWTLGYPEQAREQHARMLGLFAEPIDPFARGSRLERECQMYEFMRDNRRMLEAAQNAVALARESGMTHHLGIGMIWLGRVMAVGGEVDRGIEAVAEGREILIKLGELAYLDWYEHCAAAAYLEAGRTESGLAIVEEMVDKCAAGGVRLYEAELHRLKGELLLTAGAPTTDAEDSFRKAISIARRQRAKSWELRATLSLTRMLMKQRRHNGACSMLTEIYNWFTEGFDTADLKDAKALLDQLQT
jgi:tetratricopeptide (TPR) repeat protein